MRVERAFVVLSTVHCNFSAYLAPELEVEREADGFAVYQDDGVCRARIVSPADVVSHCSSGSGLYLFLRGKGLTLVLTLPEGKSEQDI